MNIWRFGDNAMYRVLSLMFILIFIFMAGCAGDKPKYTAEEMANIPVVTKKPIPENVSVMVLSVANQTLSSQEIILPLIESEQLVEYARKTNFQPFASDVRPRFQQLVNEKTAELLLYQKAKKSLPENIDELIEGAIDSEIRKFLLNFDGDYARAENELKKLGMNWKTFREYQKKLILSQSYLAEKLPEKAPITYAELIDMYDRMKSQFSTSAMIKFSLIDIQPAKLSSPDPNQSAQQYAMSLAEDIAEQLQAGEDFAELAKQYSHGHRKLMGGLWKPIDPNSLAEPYDVIADQAIVIHQGEIAGPLEVDGHIFIMRLEDKRKASIEPFENVQKTLEAKILIDRRKKTMQEIDQQILSQISIANMEDFIDFCIVKYYKRINGPGQSN